MVDPGGPRRRSRRRCAAGAIGVVLSLACLQARQATPFRTTVDVVNVAVTVMDRKGQTVAD